jgi:hypothetical protein
MEEGRFKRGRGAAAAPWFRVGERRLEITRRTLRINERFSSFRFRAIAAAPIHGGAAI